MKKFGLLILLCAGIMIFTLACAEKGNTVRIGVNAEMTGDMPAVGESCKKAAEMAVKEVNDAGGIDVAGRKYKVELFIEDNAGKPDQSASVAQKLITHQKVHAIVGPNAT
ncbi:MAG TPA: ABC transporter substrate-binding protein, partial [Syntrophales bacterium]|nr:ABC transporter substrate-binding protein [Syntrophales bacterium]